MARYILCPSNIFPEQRFIYEIYQHSYILAKKPPSVAFPSLSEKAPPSAVFLLKKKKLWRPFGAAVKNNNNNRGSCGVPNGFKNVRRPMRISNMCLDLKLDNGKVVFIEHKQTDRHTDRHNHRQTDKATVRYQYIDIQFIKFTRCSIWPPPNKISGYASDHHPLVFLFIY